LKTKSKIIYLSLVLLVALGSAFMLANVENSSLLAANSEPGGLSYDNSEPGGNVSPLGNSEPGGL